MNRSDITLSINRLGSFIVHPDQFCDSQCGMKTKTEYTYEVRVESTGEYLDEHGFIADNMIIKDYFDNKYQLGRCVCDSCEIMAMLAVKEIKELIEFSNPKAGISKIKVKISGSEHSFIEAEWKWKLRATLFGKFI